MLLADFIESRYITLGVLKHICQSGFDLDQAAVLGDLSQAAVKPRFSKAQERLGRVMVAERDAGLRRRSNEIHAIFPEYIEIIKLALTSVQTCIQIKPQNLHRSQVPGDSEAS